MDKPTKMLTILRLSILLTAGTVIGDSTPDGVPAKAGEFPHHVSLRFMVDDGLMHFCSGSIVGKEWVMTSATCCQGRDTMPKAVRVVAGVMDLNEASIASGEQHKNASKLIIHPSFDATFLSDDICMIKVDGNFEMSSSVQVASLPLEDAANPVGIPGLVTRWTLGEQDKSTPNHLMKVNATVVANMACNDFMLGQMICTDYPRLHSKEDCTGDFGGAFAVKNYFPGVQGGDGFTLLGIVRQNRGCGSMQDNYPEVYLKVAHYVSWINQTKKDN